MPPLPPRPDSWEDITISIFLRKSDKGYGFNMYVMTNWGVNEATDQSFDCVYVKKITEGMPAAVDGRLHVNDRIIEIDDESVEGLPYYQVINRLRRTEGSVQIKVARREEVAAAYDHVARKALCGAFVCSKSKTKGMSANWNWFQCQE